MKKIIVASQNPVKINATQKAFETMFPNQRFETQGVSVSSNVSEQPMTDEETLRGAINRAQNAKIAISNADFWIGIEGGIQDRGDRMDSFGWMVILSENRQSEARSSTFLLPLEVAKQIREGGELGPINDAFFKKHNSKQKGGAVGILTNEKVTREELYLQPLMFALIPFLREDLF